jgi:hypothetical protein
MINRSQPVTKSTWEAQKAELKARFRKLTEVDFDFDESQKNEMLNKLALKLGMTASELQDILNFTR